MTQTETREMAELRNVEEMVYDRICNVNTYVDRALADRVLSLRKATGLRYDVACSKYRAYSEEE